MKLNTFAAYYCHIMNLDFREILTVSMVLFAVIDIVGAVIHIHGATVSRRRCVIGSGRALVYAGFWIADALYNAVLGAVNE